MDLIPGINVGNAFRQVGSYVGLAPKGDYDVLDSYTNSDRAGQQQVNWLPDVTSGTQLYGAQPQVLGADTGGGGNNPSSTYTAPDPYARWGGQAGYNAARSGITTSQNNYTGAARQSLTDTGNTYDQKTRAFLGDLETGQGDINNGTAQNQLNLRQSMQNIIRGIQSGIRSGGVALAGMNASDSGASDALARAYAKVGNDQSGEARGQAATVNEDLQRKQGQLNTKKNEGVGDLNTWRDTETGRVRNDFGSKLDALGVSADGQGMGGTVNRGLVDQVLNEALGRLSQIDQSRDTRLAGVQQWSPDQIMQEALRLESLGSPGQAFSVTGPDVNYGNAIPNNGAPLGQLPIYVKGKDDLAVVPGQGRKETQTV